VLVIQYRWDDKIKEVDLGSTDRIGVKLIYFSPKLQGKRQAGMGR